MKQALQIIMTRTELLQNLIANKLVYKSPKRYCLSHGWETRMPAKLNSELNKYIDYFSAKDEALYTILTDSEPALCKVCGARAKFSSMARGYNTVCERCSPNAVKDKIDKINKSKQSFTTEQKEAIQQKRKATCLQKYGDENYGQYGSKSFTDLMENRYGDKFYNNHEKTVQTNLERYGVTTNLLLDSDGRSKRVWDERHDEMLAKRAATSQNKYAVEFPTQDKAVQQKMQQTKLDKITAFEQEHNCTLFKHLLDTYGQGWLALQLPKIKDGCHSYISNEYLDEIKRYTETLAVKYSKREKTVVDFLNELGVEVQENVRGILEDPRQELDIYLEKQKLALEFDGIYWHSELYKSENYHLAKTEACEKLGIRLIHIFEDLWNTKQQIYKSIIKSAIGIYDTKIYARACSVKELSNQECFDFLEENHLQGGINSKYRFGLFYKGELVQVICFGQSRFNSTDGLELYRMCTKLNTQVVGGFSKLIKHSGIQNFVSYIDRAVYTGNGYNSVGFQKIGTTAPGYCYIKQNTRFNRLQCQKHKLSKFLTNFDPELSEYENLAANGYYRVYDCGNYKVKYKRATA